MRIFLPLVLSALIWMISSVSTAQAQVQRSRDVVAGGGSVMGSPGFTIRGTVGQAAVGAGASPSFTSSVGYWLEIGSPATAVEDSPGRPRVLHLGQNRPNPFNPRTTITFALPETSRVRLRVYDLAGRLVGELIDEVREAGVYEQSFAPKELASGVYVYRLEAEGVALQRKLVLLK